MKDRTGLYLLIEYIVKLVETWIYESEKKVANIPTSNCEIQQTVEDRNRKITSFVGFALSSVIKIYNERERKATSDDEVRKAAEYYAVGSFLQKMRMLHKDALMNETYMLNCYSRTMQMYNNGGLALISPQYFEFAKSLTAACDIEFSEGGICRRGNDCLRVGKEKIRNNQSVRNQFDLCHDKDDLVVRTLKAHVEKIYEMMVAKTIHSRFSCEIGKVRENKFGHYAKESCTDSHRANLKHAYANGQMKTDGEAVRAKIKKVKSEANKS